MEKSVSELKVEKLTKKVGIIILIHRRKKKRKKKRRRGGTHKHLQKVYSIYRIAIAIVVVVIR